MGLPYLSMITPDPAISGYIGFYAGMIALVLIPLILLIKLAINMIWGYKSTWRFKQAMTGVWVVSFMIFLMTTIFTARNFVYETSSTQLVSAQPIDADQPLRIDINKPNNFDDARIRFGHSYLSQGRLYNRDGVAVRFIPAENEEVSISKTSISRGMNRKCALKNMNFPTHNISFQDNKLSMDEFYELESRDKYRAQRYRYDVSIPVGTVLSINEPSRIFKNYELRRHRDEDIQWVMTPSGLEQTSEEQSSLI